MSLANVFVGQPIERIEDLRLLRGRGRFIDDLTRPHVLRAVLLRSAIAHGRIRSIDKSEALAIAGVHAVLTADDLGQPLPHIPTRLYHHPSLQPFLQPVLAAGKVHYVGDPIALVIADSQAIAEDAADAVLVNIEPLPAVTDREMSQTRGILLFDNSDTNVAITYEGTRGDADAAFRDAPYTRTERFSVQRHFACPLEPRGVLAEWDAKTERMTVLGAAKVPFQNRTILSQLIGLPVENIDLLEGDVGGGFGARGEFYPEDFLIPYAARRLGRPVQWTEDRREHLMATNHSRECDCELEIACDLDGTVRGVRGRAWVDAGGYVRTHGGSNARSIAFAFAGPYRIPNYRIVSQFVLTNKTPVGTYRGPGRYECDFFRERLFDIAAQDLGIDPVEFRRRNLVSSSELPYSFPEINPHGVGDQLDSGDYEAALRRCAAAIGWEEKRPVQGQLIDGRYHGIGIGCFVEGGGFGPSENARLTLQQDGTVALSVGSSAVGQGLATIFTQIAADALELPMAKIALSHGSTTGVVSGYGSFGSRSTVMGGSAVTLAAASLCREIRQAAARRLECGIGEIGLADGIARGPGGRSIPYVTLAEEGISVEESFLNVKQTWAYGAAAAHVAVDAGTGHVELVDYVAVEDVGRIVNPLTLNGQMIGSIVQGLGGAFLEHLIYDNQGQLLTGTLADYMLPTAGDFPKIRGIETGEHPSPMNPLGVKGGGEGGIISVAGVIANAVAAALRSFGVQPRSLPLSPPRVWQLIEDARSQGVVTEVKEI